MNEDDFLKWWDEYNNFFITDDRIEIAEDAYKAGFEAGWEKHREMSPGPGK
jgi:hypothetical protein